MTHQNSRKSAQPGSTSALTLRAVRPNYRVYHRKQSKRNQHLNKFYKSLKAAALALLVWLLLFGWIAADVILEAVR